MLVCDFLPNYTAERNVVMIIHIKLGGGGGGGGGGNQPLSYLSHMINFQFPVCCNDKSQLIAIYCHPPSFFHDPTSNTPYQYLSQILALSSTEQTLH